MDLVLTILSTVFWLACALGILVFVHELGHFLAARLFGMRVDAFSLGFPPNVFKKRVGATEYRLGAIPLGGYVSIAGMVDESMQVPYVLDPVLDEDGAPVLDDDGEALYTERLDADGRKILNTSDPEPDEFRAKPVWQRIIVISAGVIFNVILAWLIYSGLALALGQRYTPAENVRVAIAEDSIADEMGFVNGDRITAINGREIQAFEELVSTSTFSADTLRVTVDRDGERVELQAPDQLLSRLSRAQQDVDDDATFEEVFGLRREYTTRIGGVLPGTPAAEAGIAPGDVVTAIGGRPVETWTELSAAVQESGGDTLRVRWERADSLAATHSVADDDAAPAPGAGGIYQAAIVPDASSEGRYLLGVAPDPDTHGIEYRRLGVGEALSAGVDEAVGVTTLYVSMVGKLFTGRENVRDNLGGPLEIARQSKIAADRGGASFWGFVAFLSIALAVFNILPIPALDGGHLVFLVYEGVTRREPSLKVRMVVQQIGLALILMLMAFVIFNDAVRWFG